MSKIRCAIYDRVSTELQAKEGLSLEAQKAALTEYALSHGYEIVGYYADEGITARKKLQNRKDLLRLLRDVEADRIDLILVTKLDRWFRNIKDYHNTQAILEAHNCNWKTIFEEYDTSTANGRFAINIMLSVNENECDRTSDRIQTIFAYKKSKKEHLNGRPGYGYTTGADKRLIKNPDTAPIVEEIIAHYFTTYSKKATVSYILAKYSGSPLCPTMYQVNRILGSETYAGRKYGIDGYCPAYMTLEQLERIRSVPDARHIPHQSEPFLFSSMIRCPICGRNMNGFVKRKQLKNGSVSEYKRYRCGAKFTEYHNGACLSESVVEKYLLAHIVGQVRADMLSLFQKKKARQKQPDKSAAIRAELERLNNMYQKGRIREEYYDEQYALLAEKLDDCTPAADTDIDASPEACLALSDVFPEGWPVLYRELDIPHRKAFWKEIIKTVHVDPESRRICGFELRI